MNNSTPAEGQVNANRKQRMESAASNACTVFKKRLKELREENHLTQEELAKLTGISRATIGYYEGGDRKPDIENLSILASALGVQPNYFLVESEGKTIDNDERTAMQTTGLSWQTIRMLATQATPEAQGDPDVWMQELPELREFIDLLCSSQTGIDAMRRIYRYVSAIAFAHGERTGDFGGHESISIMTLEGGEEVHRYFTADYWRKQQGEELLRSLKKLRKEATGECKRSQWTTIDDIFPPDLD